MYCHEGLTNVISYKERIALSVQPLEFYGLTPYTERRALSVLPLGAYLFFIVHRVLSTDCTAARGLIVYTRTQSV